MTNTNKLKGKIVENGLTVAGLAKRIQMKKATLYRKINNLGTFRIKEATAIIDALDLNKNEAAAIFFCQHVA